MRSRNVLPRDSEPADGRLNEFDFRHLVVGYGSINSLISRDSVHFNLHFDELQPWLNTRWSSAAQSQRGRRPPRPYTRRTPAIRVSIPKLIEVILVARRR